MARIIALLGLVALATAADVRRSNAILDLNDKIDEMAKELETRVSADTLGALISQSIEQAFSESATLSKMLGDMKVHQEGFDEKMAKQNSNVDAKISAMASTIETALEDIQKAQAENDKKTEDALEAIEKKLAASKTKILAEVDKKLKSSTDVTAQLDKTYLGDGKIPVYRMAKFHTYSWGSPWMDNNQATFFGGINPSTWTDGNGMASNMDWSPSVLRKIFHTRNVGDVSGLNACSEAYMQRTSTNGYICMVMFRIKNTGDKALPFTTTWRYSADMGWSERASVSLNKQSIWNGDCSSNNYCTRSITATIPPKKTSTLIFIAPSTGQHCTWNACFRSTYNAFEGLKLPNGLEFVEDLDTATTLV
jgi:hypothetical protein